MYKEHLIIKFANFMPANRFLVREALGELAVENESAIDSETASILALVAEFQQALVMNKDIPGRIAYTGSIQYTPKPKYPDTNLNTACDVQSLPVVYNAAWLRRYRYLIKPLQDAHTATCRKLGRATALY